MRPLADLANIAKDKQINDDVAKFLKNGGRIKNLSAQNSHAKTIRQAVKKLMDNLSSRQTVKHGLIKDFNEQGISVQELNRELNKSGYKLVRSARCFCLTKTCVIK